MAPFNLANYNHINSVSPDGERLYLFSGQGDVYNNLVVDKTEMGWGKPRLHRLTNIDNPGETVNEVHEARSGNLYFSGPHSSFKTGRGIVRSILKDGKYGKYQSLGNNINFPVNDPYPNHGPTVDPDERFVIFVSRRPGGYGFQDLYISYRQKDNTWGEAINLGPKINTIGSGNSWPQLSPDGKYLFFTSRVSPYENDDMSNQKYSYKELTDVQQTIRNGWANIYWVDTSFIEELRPTDAP